MEELIIIGSGPAGISASLYAIRAGIKTTVISNGIGALGKAELIENFYGYPDAISGEELYKRGIEGAKRLGVKFLEEEVVSIQKTKEFNVKTSKGTYNADAVILSMGVSKLAPYVEGLKEFEGKGVSYCAICDGFFFRNKPVAVLGAGEHALNEVNELLNVTPNVTLLTNGDVPTAKFPDTVKIITERIKSVTGEGRISTVNFENGEPINIDGLFVAYKVAGSTALAKKLGVKTDENYIVTNEKMQTNIKGLFAAGDCCGGLLQVSKAVYEGAVAGTEAVKFLKK